MTPEPLRIWKGRRVRSEGGPETAETKVPAGPLRPGSLFFVPSPLEGWGLDVLLDRLGDGVVVLFERDGELAAHCREPFASYLGARARDPRVFWLEEDTEEAVQALFRHLPLHRLRRCEFLTLNGAWMAHAPRIRDVFSRIDQGLNQWWANRMTEIHMGPLWVRNLLDNLKAGPPRAQAWPDWNQDTVLVCGAGVTLESCLPWARAHRSRLRLVAADTALPVLRAWDLVPDAVVCLEAQHANLRDFSGWLGAGVTLFTDLTSYPPGTRVFSREPRWFASQFAPLALWDRWPWDHVPLVPPMGSVGVAAAWVAWRLTRGPVVVAGLDFAYPRGQSHARGAPSLQALAARTNRFSPMEQVGTWARPGVVAGECEADWLTSPVMRGYARVMADQAAAQAHRTFVWKKQGLPLGLDPWPTDAAPPTERSPDREASPSPSPAPDPGRWLAGEREVWETILEVFDRINRAPTEEDWASLEALLRRVDYLTFWFPDPGYRRQSDWLIRAQVQVRWALSRLRRT